MNDEYMKRFAERERADKKRFIDDIGDLCNKYCILGVFSMKYKYNENTGKETVTIYYLGDNEVTVNVTADSLPAMVRDIFKVI